MDSYSNIRMSQARAKEFVESFNEIFKSFNENEYKIPGYENKETAVYFYNGYIDLIQMGTCLYAPEIRDTNITNDTYMWVYSCGLGFSTIYILIDKRLWMNRYSSTSK